jgi:hypothetical protein
MSMMSPIPFWPSFEPWAKETPVQVRIRRLLIHQGGWIVAFRRLVEGRVANQCLEDQERFHGGMGHDTRGLSSGNHAAAL